MKQNLKIPWHFSTSPEGGGRGLTTALDLVVLTSGGRKQHLTYLQFSKKSPAFSYTKLSLWHQTKEWCIFKLAQIKSVVVERVPAALALGSSFVTGVFVTRDLLADLVDGARVGAWTAGQPDTEAQIEMQIQKDNLTPRIRALISYLHRLWPWQPAEAWYQRGGLWSIFLLQVDLNEKRGI